jgi:hypothetical protein
MLDPKTKIFGVGLSRTGTLSLSRALEMLGIETRHYPNDPRTQEELKRGRYELSVLKKVQALTDITVAPFYAQLDGSFPGSKFILTTRATDDWLTSVENHFEMYLEHRRDAFDDFVLACVYGTLHFSAERFRYVKESHEESVRRYFRNTPERLLVLDVFREPGWESLCAFLDVQAPGEAFPHVNKARLEPALPKAPAARSRLRRHLPRR